METLKRAKTLWTTALPRGLMMLALLCGFVACEVDPGTEEDNGGGTGGTSPAVDELLH